MDPQYLPIDNYCIIKSINYTNYHVILKLPNDREKKLHINQLRLFATDEIPPEIDIIEEIGLELDNLADKINSDKTEELNLKSNQELNQGVKRSKNKSNSSKKSKKNSKKTKSKAKKSKNKPKKPQQIANFISSDEEQHETYEKTNTTTKSGRIVTQYVISKKK